MVRAPGPDVETTSVNVIIDEVYHGTRYDDTCVAEVEAGGDEVGAVAASVSARFRYTMHA